MESAVGAVVVASPPQTSQLQQDRLVASEKLFMATMTGDQEACDEAIAELADVDFRNQHGITPLLVVAGGSASNVGLMASILRAGADANLPDNEGWTAIIYAASSGQMPFVELLLRHGANVNVRSMDKPDVSGTPPGTGTPSGGWTALTRAAFRGQPTAVRALLEAGADTAAITGGRTALQLAREGVGEGHAEAAVVLEAWISGGASTASSTSSSVTAVSPLEAAAVAGQAGEHMR